MFKPTPLCAPEGTTETTFLTKFNAVFMSNNISSYVKLRQSTADDRSQVNDRGDKVTNLGNDHAIINGKHVYGAGNIAIAVGNLLKK